MKQQMQHEKVSFPVEYATTGHFGWGWSVEKVREFCGSQVGTNRPYKLPGNFLIGRFNSEYVGPVYQNINSWDLWDIKT